MSFYHHMKIAGSKLKLDNRNCHGQLPGFTIMDEHMMLYIVNVQN